MIFKKKMLNIFKFFIPVLLFSPCLYSADIRVLITPEAKEISFQGVFSLIVDSGTRKKAKSGSVRIDDLVRSHPHARRLRFQSENGTFRIGPNTYAGKLMILLGEPVRLINEVPVEEYVTGVLPNEISPQWPQEVLKAQAIATRTFAYYYMKQNRTNLYDLTDNTFSQVYKGVQGNHSNLNRAAGETKDIILVYDDEPVQAFFHSTCGGHTEDACRVWGKQVPYLRGIPCNYCRDSRNYAWEIQFTQEELSEKLARYGLGKIRSIAPEKTSGSGRWVSVRISGEKKSMTLSGNNLRILFGVEKIKSTKLRIVRQGGNFIVKGRGWGHGVGLCQWGARAMAEKGYKHYQILRYYYRGTRLKKIR